MKKVLLTNGFSNKNATQQIPDMYDILTEPMLVAPIIPCSSSIQIIRRLFLNPYLPCFL